jgi:phosphatidylserine decarboxylase
VSFAPEGRPFIAAAAVVLALLGGVAWWRGGWWAAAAGLWLPPAAWVALFFRDPDRPGPRGDHLVLAPADGRVVAVVQEAAHEFIRGPTTRISIFMSVFDVHVNRHPVSGVVRHRAYRPGRFVNATLDKASAHNERASLGVAGPRGPVLVRQIAGIIARRIVTDPAPGDVVRQGERLGLIRFGSRLDTLLPPGVTIRVRPGERVRAGITVVAEWLA